MRYRKDGSAAKIAATTEPERQAYAKFDRLSREAIEEMVTINGAPLAVPGDLSHQIGRTWAAGAGRPPAVSSSTIDPRSTPNVRCLVVCRVAGCVGLRQE